MYEFFNFDFDKAANELRVVYLRTPKCLQDETKAVIKRIFGYNGNKNIKAYGVLNWNMRGKNDKEKIRNAWNKLNKKIG